MSSSWEAVAGVATNSAPLGGHLVHLAGGLGFLLLTLGGVVLGERLQHASHGPRVPWGPSPALTVIALASLGSAGVHIAVTPEHFEEATSYGVFFTVAAVVQLTYSLLLLLRPSGVLVATGVVGNLALISLWLVTRTVGLPIGPDAGGAEAFGPLDSLASGCEAVVVLGGLKALLRRRTAPQGNAGTGPRSSERATSEPCLISRSSHAR